MTFRGRTKRVVEYVSDDDEESIYDELGYAPPARRARSRHGVRIIEDRLDSPPRREKGYHHRSYQGASAADPNEIIIENHLNVPQYRQRASSTGAAPQPNYLPIYVQPASREPSRERVKQYHHHSSSDESHRPSRKHRSRRQSGGKEDYLDPEIAKRLAKLELLEEQKRQSTLDPAIAERLARLKELEEKKARNEEEAAFLARLDEKKRKDKQREEALLLQYQEERRREEEAEKEAVAKAEARRMKREAEAKAERDKLMLEAEKKAAKEKAERQRIIAEENEKQRQEEEELKAERKRILLEEEAKRKKAKEEHEALRNRILAEEAERVAKEKAEKKKEEEEFQQKVKERFMKAGRSKSTRHLSCSANILPGYSPNYIEDILEEKNKTTALVTRKHSTRTSERHLAIDMARPTYIRVKIEHLYPETLDHYNLPWDYDQTDDRYLFIKDYVSHELQQELFDHTRRLKTRREKLMITDGYVKDTVTTLKPKNVYKDKSSDEMFVVRRKSVSKSPVRRSWMFT